MRTKQAVSMFGALAHEHRLRIFRMLVRIGPSGLASADIAAHAGISPTSASFHLKDLERAGLLFATRQGRYVRYALHVDGLRRLMTFITEDCCQGQPELCGSTIRAARALHCEPDNKAAARRRKKHVNV